MFINSASLPYANTNLRTLKSQQVIEFNICEIDFIIELIQTDRFNIMLKIFKIRTGQARFRNRKLTNSFYIIDLV